MRALITGAASGIGAETARKLSALGAEVAILDRNAEALSSVAGDVPGAVLVAADVTDGDQLAAAVRQVTETMGGLDVLVANAGISPLGPFETMDPDLFEMTIDVNLLGVVRTVRTALPSILESEGYIVLVSSMAAVFPGPLLAHYCASKAGVEAFGVALRGEVRHKGVDVGIAYFGYVDTPLLRAGLDDPLVVEARKKSGKLAQRTYPVEEAASRMVAGIAKRRETIVYPGFNRPFLPMRGYLGRSLARRLTRARIGDTVDAMNSRARGG